MSANRLKFNVDKTEFVWTGSERNLQSLRNCGKTLTLGTDTFDVADSVRVFDVILTPDLSLEKHVTAVSSICFFQLRQLRRIRRSLDGETVANR